MVVKGLPAVVIRVLIFRYEEQVGWVKLGGRRSASFKLSNGTRQGSVLSPLLFSVYLDDLLVQLRQLQLGCHIGGWWYGAMGYADDLILLAPNREVLQTMVQVCEKYGKEHNLVFSTDPVPAKSKTKCLYFCGRTTRVNYPDPVQLDGKSLPWVQHAEHLGHTLHQTVSMDMDCTRARAKFIGKSVDVRESFSFAKPDQVLQMVQLLCTDAYGSMLWDLRSSQAEQFFKCWNTCVKLVYGVPCQTFTYLVEGYFAQSFVTLRNQVLSRYPGFFRNLLSSPSKEVRMLASMVAADPRSTTCSNLKYLREITSLDQAEQFSSRRIRESLPVKSVPARETWRLGLITELMNLRSIRYREVKDFQQICGMIDSLCST